MSKPAARIVFLHSSEYDDYVTNQSTSNCWFLADTYPVDLPLPVQWIWDIVDEFVYQYQEYCQFQSKIKDRTQEETAQMKLNPKVWNVVGVIKYLVRLISKSDIKNTLEREKR